MTLATMADSLPIPDDLNCVQCGYNLRELTNSGRCPECGSPVADTIDALAPLAPETFEDMRRRQLEPLARSVGGTLDGLLFVLDAVLRATELSSDQPISARDVCAAFRRQAMEYFNDKQEATELLHEWGIHRSEDVGRLLGAAAAVGALDERVEARPEEFLGLFTVEQLLRL